MPQDFADLGQRRTPTKHLGRQGVPELMSTLSTTVDSSARQRLSDDCTHCAATLEADGRRFRPQEHRAVCRAQAPAPQISSDRLPYICRQRELGVAATFASHGQTAGFPIDIR